MKKPVKRGRATKQPAPAARELEIPEGVAVGLLCGILAVAAVAYWALVPYGQGPDEASHGLFVQTLAGEAPEGTPWAWGLPVLQTKADDPNFETHQPPLFYLLAALAYRVGGLTAAAGLSLLFSLGLVWVTWRLIREVMSPDLALGAAAVVALLPMNAFLATRLSNDPLTNLLWVLALWRWVIALRDGPSLREGGWSGLAVGLALLTKQSSLGLIPLAFVAAALAGRLSGKWGEAWKQLGLTLLVALLVAGWWYLRNVAVYHDLLAQKAFDARFLATRPTRESVTAEFRQAGRPFSYWPFVGNWVVRTFVFYVGIAFDRLPSEIFPVQIVLLVVAGGGSAVFLARRWRRAGLDPAMATALLLAAGMILVTLLLVRFNQTYFQGQGRYLFPLLPGWGLMLSGGPGRCLGERPAARRYGAALAPLWFGLLNALLMVVYLPGLFEAQP